MISETKVKPFAHAHHQQVDLIPAVYYGGGQVTIWGCFGDICQKALVKIDIIDHSKYKKI